MRMWDRKDPTVHIDGQVRVSVWRSRAHLDTDPIHPYVAVREACVHHVPRRVVVNTQRGHGGAGAWRGRELAERFEHTMCAFCLAQRVAWWGGVVVWGGVVCGVVWCMLWMQVRGAGGFAHVLRLTHGVRVRAEGEDEDFSVVVAPADHFIRAETAKRRNHFAGQRLTCLVSVMVAHPGGFVTWPGR